tara:strand:+ start:20 stop:1786 length:1767 start_codon:yes stop_codon:yes gene_type:complete
MAGIPFLHNIDLKDNQLLNAKLHTSGTAPSNPGTGTIWYDSDDSLVKVYDGGWNTISGDITGVTSATTNQLTVANSGGPAPAFSIVTAAIANGGTGLATADQIHTFVTTQTDDIAASTTGTAAIATTVTVADESSDTTCFPLFATAATGNLGPKSGDNLTFNSATGILTATGFSGPLTGSLTIGGHLVDDIDIGTEFTDADDHLMSSSAIKEKIENYGYITASSTDTLTNKTIAASQVTEISNLTAAEGAQIENIDSTTISATQWGYLGAASGAITNTDVDVNVSNLTARLPQITESVTIGDATDVVITTSGNLVVTGDLTVSGDTVTVNTATMSVEDPLIILASGNAADTVDVGLYAKYVDGTSTTRYAGMFRDASATGDPWVFFDGLEAAPTTTVNTSGAGYDLADISAGAITSADGFTGTILTASQTNITGVGTISTGTWAATDVAVAHGGTGASTASAAFDNLKQAATTSATGVVELATTTEASTGTDSSRAVTADGLQQFHNDRNKSFELDNSVSGVASSDNITYTITHGMGASRLYKVEIIEDATNYETVYAKIQRPSDTTITVAFASTVTAGAYRALITKI